MCIEWKLFSGKNEWPIDVLTNMDESQNNNAKRKKLEPKKKKNYILHDSIYMFSIVISVAGWGKGKGECRNDDKAYKETFRGDGHVHHL